MKRLSEYLYDVLNYKLDARKKALLFWTGLITLCANGYAFVNYMPLHDAVNHMFWTAGQWEVQLGRFLQPYYVYLRGKVASPWLIGMIGTVFAVMSACIIADIIKIKNPVCEILACGFLVANLSVTELCGIYIYMYDCCMISLFFSCLSVWCWLHISCPWNIIFGGGCLMLSMGFYQAYISVAIALSAVVLLQRALADTSWKEEMRSALTMVLMTIIGTALYLLLYKIMLVVWQTIATNGSNGMGRLAELSVRVILQNVMKTYKDIWAFFVVGSRHFGRFIRVLHGMLLLIALAGFIILLIWKKLKIFNSIVAILIFTTLPIWSNFISVIQGEIIVPRSSYALYLLFPICLKIVDELSVIPVGKSILYIAGVICFFLVIRNVQYSNTVYMYARLTYDRTISIMTRVLDDMEETEGYEGGVTPVAVIGGFQGNDYVEIYHKDYRFMTGERKTSTTYPQTIYNFWRSLGSPVNAIQDDEILGVYAESNQVKQMPCYPYAGYCQMVDDVLIVKIAE